MNMSLSQENAALQRAAAEAPEHPLVDVPMKGIRPNIVQSKQDVIDLIGQQFKLVTQGGKNFDALYDSMTDPVYKSGPQPGFIAVLEHIPANVKFDKEAREQLLDIFRDTADYWGDRKIPFRCFYSFL